MSEPTKVPTVVEQRLELVTQSESREVVARLNREGWRVVAMSGHEGYTIALLAERTKAEARRG